MKRLTDVAFWEREWWGRERPRRLWLYRDFDFELVRLLWAAGKAWREVQGGVPRVIELGAGGSRLLPYLARHFGYRVFGSDFSLAGCRLLRANLALQGVEGGVVCDDVLQSALSPATFDLVFSTGLIEHFDDTAAIIAEHVRLLRPGGQLVLVVPNLQGVQGRITRRLAPPLWDVHRVLSPAELADLLRRLKLREVRCGYLGSFFVHIGCDRGWSWLRGWPGWLRLALHWSVRLVNGVVSFMFRLSPWRPHSRLLSPAFFAAASNPGVNHEEAIYRVLVVTNLWPTEADPGYGSFVEAQMESLRPLGVDFDVLFINGRESSWNYLRAIGELRRRLRAGCYDLIHAHFGLSGWVARCQRRVPVVVSFMGDDVLGRPRRNGRITLYGHFLRASSFLLARLVDAVIVKSAEMKRKLRLPRAQVIPNGVDLELFRPMDQEAARRRLGLDLRKKFVLFPYNPAEERKRFDLIEAAVKRARPQVPELEILRVQGVPRAHMPLYMNAADVLVLASVFEGSPNAVKEAMATNLPVITVDVGDAAELIGATEGCYLVTRDAEAIAEKIVEVCRRATRSSGREWISRLAMEKIAKQIIEVYSKVIHSSATA